MKIPIASISVGDRQRVDIGDLDDLNSMSDPEVGQVLPIAVHRLLDRIELVDGRRRLAKAVALGWTEIEAVDKGTLTPVQKQKQELFADIGRKDRTWQENCLSISRIHSILEREKRADGQKWTIEHTASFTNFGGATKIKYMLKVADALEALPRDAEVWAAATYTEAWQLLLGREATKVRADLELRRAKLQEETMPLVLPTAPAEADYKSCPTCDNQCEWAAECCDRCGYEFEEAPAVPVGDRPAPASPRKVYIRGHNIAFEDAVEGEHFLDNCFYAAIAFNAPVPGFKGNLRTALRPEGFAVLWYDRHGTANQDPTTDFANFPSDLIWNQIGTPEPSAWPFTVNYARGFVLAKAEPTTKHPNPAGCVVACHPEGTGLPYGVVEWTLNAICPPNMAVLCPWDAPVLEVAMSGHPPIFFEADPVKFAEKVAILRAYYESQGLEVEL